MSDENAIACLREGADDYILKSNLSRLPAAIHRSLRARKLEKLKREARYALRKQNSELLKVNHELDNFVYAVSHSLRGPVASIMGLLNIAATKDGRKQIESLLGMIRDRTLRLDETVREILEFSNNARSEISFSEIDWNRTATNAWERLTYLPQAKNVLHLVHVGHSPEAFASDPMRINLIFNCVYSNAIIYSDPNRESIVGTEVAFRDEHAVITIKDNGVGIAQSCLPSVFNMFYRANEKSQGAGLGLYIARETVRKLRGSIEITSEEDRGTTVTIVLPNEKSRLK
jgi:signal transduction histidine kinase